MSEEKKKKKLEDLTGSLGASPITDDEDEDEEETSSSATVSNDFTYCYKCKTSFPTASFIGHSPCFDK